MVEYGHFFLNLALMLALLQAVIGLFGAHFRWASWIGVTPLIALLQCVAVLASFSILILAFAGSDFSVALVAQHSHSTKPLLYKLAGSWGNHEGSMLMWVSILALFGAAIALASRSIPAGFRARVIGVQGLIGAAFHAFIIFTSNPFSRLASPPRDGSGLNPILQDPGIALHPPFLYLGYVGLSVSFAFAIAGLFEGRIDQAWARFVRPWTLAAWMFLTIGIALGSWWAYYELGWGGYWFWDPVENASLMPWLIAGALLHSALVFEKRNTLASWSVLLAIMGFGFSLIGTFIVRSGVLTSVHSFTSDPTRGSFILAIMFIAIGGGFALYALRAARLTPRAVFAPISRESAIIFNNLLLISACAIVFVGTFWPLIIEAINGKKLSVGPPFFDLSFTPFFIVLALILPIGAIIPWKRARLARLGGFLLYSALASALFALLVVLRLEGWSLIAPIAAFLSAWIIGGSLIEIARKLRPSRENAPRLARLFAIRRSEYGKYLGHSGFALVILAVGVLRGHEFEDLRSIRPPHLYQAGGFEIEFRGIEEGNGPNYSYQRGDFLLSRNGRNFVLQPENRFYPVEDMPTTEAAIVAHKLGDLYLVLRPGRGDGNWSVYFYIKPLARLLWIGSGLMAFGALLSLLDRRGRAVTITRREIA